MRRSSLSLILVIAAAVPFPVVAAETALSTTRAAAAGTPADGARRLWEAARSGSGASIRELVLAGVDIDAVDEEGRTALHYAAERGHLQTVETLLKAGADPTRRDREGLAPLDLARRNGHDQTAALLRGAATSKPSESGQRPRLSPSAKYPDLASFERAIGKPATLLQSEHVWFFAAKTYQAEARIIYPYLVKAYEELRRITGTDTDFIMVVYHFPKDHPDVQGGTSGCVIWYDESNLRLDEQEEWERHHRPHVSGYIEEMAHNFVSATRAQFGWEMIGWSLGTKVCEQVAGNPLHSRQVEQTRREQQRTFERYKAQGFTLPNDLPANLVDRVHAWLLWRCEQRYGESFWPDFFRELAKHRKELEDAARRKEPDAERNERYRITVECFDRLRGLNFKQVLQASHISATVDVKSLHPTELGWNRRLE